jgi:hypothetical protein
MNHPDMVVGGELGISFPTSIEALLAAGADFLSTAFRASGVLGEGNRVTAITDSREFFGGGMGRKLLLTIAYQHQGDGLHTELFVKFPRDFGDPLRELFGPLMEPEVRFALLSRGTGFPIAVPRCYFADYDEATTSGLLITETIAYGQHEIEPCHEKCVDYELENPLGHYQALTRTMARLAAYHRAGNFGPELDRKFPFDPTVIDTGSRIPYTPDELREKLERLLAFADQAPRLFPDALKDSAFLARFVAQAPAVLEHEEAIRSYLNQAGDCIALCHWNMNLDNAWFWKDEQGVLNAGLLDWGSVGQMNLAQGLYGMTCAAEADFLNTHRHDLLELFAREYAAGGGPRLDLEELLLQYRLSVAVLGIAWILDAPSLIEGELPNFARLQGRRDPKLRSSFLARAQLQLLMVFLNEWQAEDIGEALRRFGS